MCISLSLYIYIYIYSYDIVCAFTYYRATTRTFAAPYIAFRTRRQASGRTSRTIIVLYVYSVILLVYYSR